MISGRNFPVCLYLLVSSYDTRYLVSVISQSLALARVHERNSCSLYAMYLKTSFIASDKKFWEEFAYFPIIRHLSEVFQLNLIELDLRELTLN
jgi:hypothetical protein